MATAHHPIPFESALAALDPVEAIVGLVPFEWVAFVGRLLLLELIVLAAAAAVVAAAALEPLVT